MSEIVWHHSRLKYPLDSALARNVNIKRYKASDESSRESPDKLSMIG